MTLLGAFFARGRVAELLTDEAWVQALVEVEAALARAHGREQLAQAILEARIDLAEIDAEAGRTASPMVPIVRMLRERAGSEVHVGATSQDIVDTASMLVVGRALEIILDDARGAAEAAARLAARHRNAPVMGRTLLQHALPTSFGVRAARWMSGLDDACQWLERVRACDLTVDFGGPIGHGDPAVAAAMADDLRLHDPGLAWHAIRLRPVRIASALAGLCGILGKIARDVTLLAQQEIAEVAEGDDSRGGSSSIAHKNNPVAAVTVLMCTRRIPGLISTVFATMEQEHERGAAGWQIEWATMTELVRLTGSATAWSRDMLENLRVDLHRMSEPAGPEPDLGFSADLTDRAIAAHEALAAAAESDRA
jgi:3-carboxy-cis,cis-muconate cycloisomerase